MKRWRIFLGEPKVDQNAIKLMSRHVLGQMERCAIKWADLFHQPKRTSICPIHSRHQQPESNPTKELSIGNLLPINGIVDFINDEEKQLLGKQSLKKM